MAEEHLALFSERNITNKFLIFLLKPWQPVPKWSSTILLFLIIGLALVGFGVGLIIIDSKIIEVSVHYDTICENQYKCNVPITIPETMNPPIFFYYGLDNFYQNHRLYVKSKNSNQLKGDFITPEKAANDCDPVPTNALMQKTEAIDTKRTPLDLNAVAIPCGLIAKTFFNDTYKMHRGYDLFTQETSVFINETGIAWSSDLGEKFKNTKDLSLQWQDMTDEHFIVWMRTASLPNFRKLWGRIEVPLAPGRYTVVVTNSETIL